MGVHRYMESVAVFLCGLTDVRPEPFDFGQPTFWGGKYITSIDLIHMAQTASCRVPVAELESLGVKPAMVN